MPNAWSLTYIVYARKKIDARPHDARCRLNAYIGELSILAGPGVAY